MRVYVETYGCAANQGDASIAEGVLEGRGHEIVGKMEDADVLVLFTCIVIDRTEQRMLHRMKVFGESGKRVVVAGCMASAMPDTAKNVLPDAALLPPESIQHISDIVEGREVEFHRTDKSMLPMAVGRKVNIPISDGCLYNCSYCITKKARGNLTSYSEDGIVNTARNAIENGCMEVRLTSQDTAAYGMDSGDSLASVVNNICKIDGNFRVRIGMMHPLSLRKRMDEVIDSLSCEKVYKFVHLPLQSGSDDILEKMRRGYTVGEFAYMVEELREKIPGIAIATDAIVAFPTETDEQFEETCDAVKKIRPDVINITRFSPRPGTDAKKMDGRIDTKTAKERSRKMTEIASRISLEKNLKYVGRTCSVFITERKGEWMVGKTENYKPVFVRDGKPGDSTEVGITGATETHLIANPVS